LVIGEVEKVGHGDRHLVAFVMSEPIAQPIENSVGTHASSGIAMGSG
jgi:hypothetical protein